MDSTTSTNTTVADRLRAAADLTPQIGGMGGTPKTTTAPRTSTVHADAADLIEAQGWTQHGFYPGWDDTLGSPNRAEAAELINLNDSPACAVGALAACGGGDPEIEALARHLVGDSLLLTNKAEEVVVAWNDSPSTTKDDVVRALRSVTA